MADRIDRPTLLSLAHLTVLDADPLTLIDAAEAGGFNAVGLRVVPPNPTDRIVPMIGNESLIRQFEQRLNATGIKVLDIEAVWLTPDTDVAGLRPALELGARLGARNLIVAGNDPDERRQRDNFAALCDLAGSVGLGLALEPTSYAALRTLPQASALLTEIGRPNARLLIDALHFYRSGAKAGDLQDIDPTLFSSVHLCDASLQAPDAAGLRAEGRSGRRFPGEGELPLAEFMAAFPSGIPVAVEAPCAAYADLPPVERARICGAATRAFLSDIGRSVVMQTEA